MNSLKLVNLFTYVVIFFSAVSFWPNTAEAQSTKEDCIAAEYRRLAAGCNTGTDEQRNQCDTRVQREANNNIRCSSLPSRADTQAQDSECDGLYDRVLSEMEEAEQECGKAGWGNISSCTSRATMCGNALSLDQGEENVTQGISNLMGMWAMSQSAQNGTSANSMCTVVDQNAERSRKERIEDQISRLQEQNQDSVTKQAELDDDFSKRQEETEEKIREAEEDVEKKKIERQTKIQEENTRIQKAVLTSQKKQFDNLQNINKKNVEIANMQFAVQQINIQSSDLRMNQACSKKVEDLQATLMLEKPLPGAPANAPPKKRKLTAKDAQKIKQTLKQEETTCLQLAALERTAQLKGLFDKRTQLQADVDTLTRANEDEAKSIEIEKKAFEELKVTMDKEEQTDAENKFKKLNTLSASLARFKETIDKKKKSQADRIALREQQIQRLILSKNDVVVKELNVDSKLRNASRTRTSFTSRCCSRVGRTSAYSRSSSSSSSGSRTAATDYRHPSCATAEAEARGSGTPTRTGQ